MKVTEVQLRMIRQPRLKAIASITLDSVIPIDDIKVIQAKKRLCIIYPQNINRQYIVAPRTPETSAELENAVLAKYKNELESKEGNHCTQMMKCTGVMAAPKAECAVSA
mgnify:FL=1